MYMLDKQYAGRIAGSLASEYYQEWIRYFEKVLRATRNTRHKNKDTLLAIQLKLARIETQLWDLLSEGREQAKTLHAKTKLTEEEKKDLKGYENHILIHEQLIRISRTICDGIAWRHLGYNRAFLTSSARGFGTGRVDVNSKEFKSEFEWAYRITKGMDSLVLINDLTHFLKVGDLTEINHDVAFIHEIKKYGKDVKNMFTLKGVKGKAKISDQAKRLLELQRIALAGGARISGTNVGVRKIDLDLKSHFKRIKKLLRESESKMIVSASLDDCTEVEVTNFKAIMEKKADLEELKKLSPKEDSSDLLLTHSNWDSFYSDEQGNFLRAAPPYSVFPFSAKDCADLMSGNYLVKTTLNVNKLKEVLKANNWEIEERSEEDLDRQIAEFEKDKGVMFTVKEGLYAHTPDDGGLFTIRRGAFSVAMDSLLYCRLTMEYMTMESFLEILEEMYKIAAKRQSSDMYFPQFKNEKDMWN